jgi:hypothetical protein
VSAALRPAPGVRGRHEALAVLCLAATFCAYFSVIRPTNFGGWDEWLYLSLADQGIVSIPYANRPLVLLCSLPAAKLAPHDLEAQLVAHGAYLLATGVAVFVTLRWLIPGARLLALLAGTFAALWAPLDYLRLDTVLTAGYAGFTCMTFASLALFVAAWRRGSLPLLASAAVLGAVAARGFEGVLPLLLGAPLLLVWLGRACGGLLPTPPRRAFRLGAVWSLVMLGALVSVALPLLAGGGSYQLSALKPDLRPSGVASRLLAQLGFHLLPLFEVSPAELGHGAAWLAGLVFVLGTWAVARGEDDTLALPRAALLRVAFAGLLLAGLGWAAFLPSASITNAARTQFLSAPGVGFVLAAGIALAARLAPRRFRRPALAALGAWVVVVGVARTSAMQQDWDHASYWPAQARLLRSLVAAVPDVEPNTLLLLRDGSGAFPADFTFRHAVDLLYGGRALGLAWGARDFLYPVRVLADGFEYEPWPVIRGPWHVAVTHHAWHEVVVVSADSAGAVHVEGSWPSDLPGHPDDYDPMRRLRRAATPPPARALLRER